LDNSAIIFRFKGSFQSLGCLFKRKWHLQAPTLSALFFYLLSKELISLASKNQLSSSFLRVLPTGYDEHLSWSLNFI